MIKTRNFIEKSFSKLLNVISMTFSKFYNKIKSYNLRTSSKLIISECYLKGSLDTDKETINERNSNSSLSSKKKSNNNIVSWY